MMQHFFQFLGAMALAVLATILIQGAMQAPVEADSSPLTSGAFSDECMIGEVRLFAGNFAPRNYALCDGQLLSISSNTALFSILGTTYGGDGRVNFALPDLRGRAPIHVGAGTGLAAVKLGEKKGTASQSTQGIVGVQSSRTGKFFVHTESDPTNYPPSLGINYVICVQGIFPSRN